MPDVAGSVDLAGVITQVGAVAIALAGLYVVMRGARAVLGFIRG
jgi:hypothetical protein